MQNEISILERTAIADNDIKPPDSKEVVASLLDEEKQQKKQAKAHPLKNLVGNWNLRFITGTQKTRQKAGVVLGAGKYIPQFIQIQIQYTSEDSSSNYGRVTNSVRLLGLQISLMGPIKFVPRSQILAFDFTELKFSLGGFNLYQGYIRNGQQREAEFSQKELKHQAFFKYFLIEDNLIAARGKGGGLALWCRERE
ncbi:MAG: hypothetical protein AAFQ41_16975 [Cyanobacteria bacterium J06623_7]